MSDKPLFFVIPNEPTPTGASAASMGSKAYGLLRLARLGLPVPPAFVLGTELCRTYFAQGGRWPEHVRGLLTEGIARLEDATGRKFGGARRPLLVSVRSGAPVSMPGMMATILNIGLSSRTVPGLLRATGNPRQVRDCYRRLIRDFSEVVHEAPAASFDAIVERYCHEDGLASSHELDSAALARIVDESLETALALTGQPFPEDPLEQLVAAVEAVWRSWNSPKAQHYRRINHIDDALGTAVTVQAMVFGNSGPSSGAGVGFTRDPASGEDRLYLDFLFNAQGEDVVSGRHVVDDSARLSRQLPLVAAELQRLKGILEGEFRDMQDFEFTVEEGRLFMLQTRAGKRTPWAALQIAVDMVREGQITPSQARDRLRELDLERIERAHLGTIDTQPLATAVSASLGVASGALAFDASRAAELAAQGRQVILARPDIDTADVQGIAAAAGVVTTAGGRTSHAAVVARQLGKVCLVGCNALQVRADGTGCTIGAHRFTEGDEITLDGEAGRVYAGALALVHERPEAALKAMASWPT